MQLDKLQIELRPRTNAQALDLGFTILRAHAPVVYGTWLALWLPAMAVAALLSVLMPAATALWVLLPWWFSPLFERAPLYVLARAAFGERVTIGQALRAWPRQLGGGWLQLLTWGRLFSAGRSFYQPIWQLELARGKVARDRRRMMGARGTSRSAFWFGIVCVHLEAVLQMGLIALVGIFLSDDQAVNPFSAMFAGGEDAILMHVLTVAGVAVSGAIIGPVYIACGFTLYLNRRAQLEAWDIDIALRQIVPPQATTLRRQAGASVLAVLLPLLLALPFMLPAPAMAADAIACEPEQDALRIHPRGPAHVPAQLALRKQLDTIYAAEDLRGYECSNEWRMKDRAKRKDSARDRERDQDKLTLDLIARVIKVILIAGAIALVGWLLYRFREHLPALRRPGVAKATEVGGLDIRASSLPDDVVATVAALWESGERRAALGLLYRATLARLVNDDALLLHQGATEGDCLRLAREAARGQRLSEARLQVAVQTTALWLAGAYGDRWPATSTVREACAAWRQQFAHAGAPPA